MELVSQSAHSVNTRQGYLYGTCDKSIKVFENEVVYCLDFNDRMPCLKPC